jgi:DNA adenine methylase
MTAPRRPVLRYHGGKWRLAPWIISFFPGHRTYVEPYGGGASVLMRKPRSYAEVYNELSPVVVNVFRVLRNDGQAAQLREALRLTPFARAEFEAAYEDSADPVEWARRAIVRAYMGFGSGSIHDALPRGMRTRASTWRPPTGFRSKSNRSGTTPAHDWANYPDVIEAFADRLRGVVIEQREAVGVIETHDSPETLQYIDPPYPHSTRNVRRPTGVYRHEMGDDDHRALAALLHGVSGMVVVSGYPCELYDRELYPDWERYQREHLADGARKRTEVVWLNPACSARLRSQRSQFDLSEVAS